MKIQNYSPVISRFNSIPLVMYIREFFEAEEQSPTPSVSVTALYYEGIDVNPQKIMLGYNVTEDDSFVTEIYNIFDFENRVSCDGPSTAIVSIKLMFSGSAEELTIEVDPNDLAWTISNNNPAEYFTLPKGGYNKISTLLTGYTEEHFLPDVNIKTLAEMVQVCDRFTFYGDDSDFLVNSEDMTDFPDELSLEGWSKFTPPDGEHSGRRFSIADESYIYNVQFLIDMRQVYVSKQGIFTWYELTFEAAELIWLWYGDILAIYARNTSY